MNREIPKPLTDALGRQMAGETHPSSDVLSAFAEHNLPHREKERVTDHLARCADCREIVFVASSALEEPVREEQELMPATAVPRISPALQAKKTLRTVDRAGPNYSPPHRRWLSRWVWVPAVAAALVVSGVLFVKRSEFRSAATTIASKSEPPAVSQPTSTAARTPESEPQSAPEPRTTLEAKKPVAKVIPPQANPAPASNTLADAKSSGNASAEYSPPPKGEVAPSVGGFAAKSLTAGAAAPPPPQNAFVESETQGTTTLLAKPYAPSEAPPVAVRGLLPTHPQWRISPEGHLERENPSGGWSRVLAEQPATFRAVSVIGNNLWAGGSGGALFHSSDGGQSWSKQPVGSPAVETGTIVAIRFSDAMHGVITTQSGARWSTSDGGVTWTRE